MTLDNPFTDFVAKPRPRRPGEPEPDITPVRIEHRGMLADLSRLARALSDPAGLGAERAEALGWYADGVARTILRHHQIEDHVAWPTLAACAGDAVDLDPLSDDHARLDGAIEEAVRLAGELAAGTTSAAPKLAAILSDLHKELDEHIAIEDESIYPAYLRYVSAEAGREEMMAAMSFFPPDELGFTIPYLNYHATPQEARHMKEAAGQPWIDCLNAFGEEFLTRRAIALPPAPPDPRQFPPQA